MELKQLIAAQQGSCYYCKCEMTFSEKNGPAYPTVEHLKDKWASPKHKKIEASSNKVAACFKCNNTRGAERNKVARGYYQKLINKERMNIRAASTKSTQLYKMFGPIPVEVFPEYLR